MKQEYLNVLNKNVIETTLIVLDNIELKEYETILEK